MIAIPGPAAVLVRGAGLPDANSDRLERNRTVDPANKLNQPGRIAELAFMTGNPACI